MPGKLSPSLGELPLHCVREPPEADAAHRLELDDIARGQRERDAEHEAVTLQRDLVDTVEVDLAAELLGSLRPERCEVDEQPPIRDREDRLRSCGREVGLL